ncbi:MAG: hypothetical protein NTV32_06720 [Gammaproteobacteria bacterium]|nr:hypothetical protein [Gammaproteobacteria bacterium]
MPSNLTQEEETNRLMKELEGEYVLRTGTQMPHAPQSPIKALSPREIEMHDFSKTLASIPAVPTHPIKAGSSEAPRHAGKSQDDSGAVLAKSARRKPLDRAKAPVKPQSKTEANLPPKKPGLWSRFLGQWKATAKVMDEVGKKTTFLERGWARFSAFVKILRHGGVKDAAAAAQSETKSISKDSSTLKTEKSAHQTEVDVAKKALRVAKNKLNAEKQALTALKTQISAVTKQIQHTEDPTKCDQLKRLQHARML